MIGRTISHYQILDKLGEGGMGEVYRAQDIRLGRLVGLKFLSGKRLDEAAAERFIREARAASALNHPNIITIYDVGESEAGRFIAMELVQGRTLRSLAGLSLEELCRIGAQVAKGLGAAHAAGIVHRDIKPENIMVRDDGYVKVLDFGLARMSPAEIAEQDMTTATVTAPGTLLGTLRYMSPEQARGEFVTTASDMFSLGIVLYELATGRHPFAAESQIGVLHAIISQVPLPPSRLRPEMPAALEAVLLQLLEKDPRLRPAAAAVEAALTESPAQPATAPAYALPRHTVGRQKELQELQAAYDSAAAGRGLIAGVAGEPGIGKSTLVDDFMARLTARGEACRIARGRCSERLAGNEAYLPILEALESLLHGQDGEAASRIMKLVAPTWYVQVAPLVSDDSSLARVMREAKTASQERMKRELVAFLQEMSRLRPLILFLDDLHWADISTVDLLAYIGSKLESMRLLIIGAYRPSDLLLAKHPLLPVKLELQGRGLCREIAIEFLTRDDIEIYLALEFPEHRFPPELGALIHARTEGNPLFMADLVRYLKDHQVIAQQEGRWMLARSLPDIERDLPESVRSMIQKKIEQLSDADRRLLVAASVQGHEFDSAVAAKALDIGQADVEERLEALDRLHAFVRLAGDHEFPDSTLTLRYCFVHVLYQNALYNSLTATRRASLSAAVAEALLGFYGDQSAEVACELALLLQEGRDFARASDYFLRAAGKARRAYANQEALALARRALANAEKLKGAARHAGVAAAAFVLAEVHQTLTQLEEAIADFARAEEAARNGGDLQAEIGAILGQAGASSLFKRLEQADQHATRAMELARRAGSDIGVASAEARLAGIRLVQGNLVEANRFYESAIPVLQRGGPSLIALLACASLDFHGTTVT